MTNRDFSKEEILKRLRDDITSKNSPIPVINERGKVYKEVSNILNVVEQITEADNLEDLKILLIDLIITGSLKVNSPESQNKYVKDYLSPATMNEYENKEIDTSDFKPRMGRP